MASTASGIDGLVTVVAFWIIAFSMIRHFWSHVSALIDIPTTYICRFNIFDITEGQINIDIPEKLHFWVLIKCQVTFNILFLASQMVMFLCLFVAKSCHKLYLSIITNKFLKEKSCSRPPSLTSTYLFDILWRATCSSILSSTFCSSRPRVSSTSSEMSFRMPLRTRNIDSAQRKKVGLWRLAHFIYLLVLRQRLLRRVPQF